MKICLTNEGKTYRFYLPRSGLLLKVVLKIALPVEKEKAKGQGSDEGEKTHIARKDSENGEEGVAKTDGEAQDSRREKTRTLFTRREKAEILSSAEEMRKVLKACRRKLGKFILIEARDSDGDGISVRI